MNIQVANKSSFLIFFVIFICHYGNAKLAPDYIHPCSDTSRECLIKATQDAIPGVVKGIPELGVPSMDPMTFDKLTISLNNLTFNFYNGKMTGFKKCVVDNIVSLLDKRKFLLAFHCNLTLKSTYDAKGQFLLFAIDGGGDAMVKLTNLKMNLDINTKYIKDKNNIDYFSIKNYKYTFDYGDHVFFDFKNLFKGNKQLSDAVLQVLNQNWRTVVQDFGKPFLDFAVGYSVNTMKKFFHSIPYNELIYVPIPL
ncbi:unnamed protein product [Arctia plantaginis]|uniref:Uncharacterized protein n=1 Tax=Arctia plantaginis TaxID=874455 RepID=A0A8S1B067_ARCPL|nr:unnamed protein product [Arctia plantaginis]